MYQLEIFYNNIIFFQKDVPYNALQKVIDTDYFMFGIYAQ